jgi:hypothetical protein
MTGTFQVVPVRFNQMFQSKCSRFRIQFKRTVGEIRDILRADDYLVTCQFVKGFQICEMPFYRQMNKGVLFLFISFKKNFYETKAQGNR